MGWVANPHVCSLPMTVPGSVGRIGALFECDHCKATWRVQARVIVPGHESFYNLTFTRRVGDYVYTRSWQDED